MELLIAILIAFGFVNADEASNMSKDEAVRIFTENKLNDKAEAWVNKSENKIWVEEAGDFIWVEEAGDF
ncbi:MAG: hypothetical protein ACI9FU_000280 [Granulosicoccus sp.]|jgi:hypothetical protein